MNLNNIKDSMTRAAFGAKDSVKQHSPEILLAVGILGMLYGTYEACKATLQASEKIDNTKKTVERLTDCHERAIAGELTEEYSDEEYRKDMVTTYAQATFELTKTYAKTVVIDGLAIASLIGSHSILRKRNASLLAAYVVLDKAYSDYQKRVVERFGEDLNNELKYDIKSQKIETIVTDEDGKEVIESEYANSATVPKYSPYARVFDEACKGWSKDPQRSLMQLQAFEEFANQKLRTEKKVYLNDVYEMLGIPKSSIGQFVGWKYDKNNNKGDNRISFRIFDASKENCRSFVNGYERNLIIDPNVDGIIVPMKRDKNGNLDFDLD